MTREAFPCAKVNVLSLIPRRAKYRDHIRNMHAYNLWLEDFCETKAIRFVNVWSFFLIKTPNMWPLSKKLFSKDLLHFSNIGDSILGRVLIGVANSPR